MLLNLSQVSVFTRIDLNRGEKLYHELRIKIDNYFLRNNKYPERIILSEKDYYLIKKFSISKGRPDPVRERGSEERFFYGISVIFS